MTDAPSLLALSCPQCAAPLPRAARWRTVNCSYCGATIVRGDETVRRAAFAEALRRSRQAAAGGTELRWRDARYTVVQALGRGEFSDVLLARRLGAAPELVTFKIAVGASGDRALQREVATLTALQALQGPGSAYFSRRLPQPIGLGAATVSDRPGMHTALALRHPSGHWGSLADVQAANPQGVDPRHGVWLWRRMLEVLAFVHQHGWAHRDLVPEHALVQPADHGVRLIGWTRAERASPAVCARDLMQAAWTVRSVLHGAAPGEPGVGAHTPAPLAELLRQCSEDAAAAQRLGASGIEAALTTAARAAFGAPQFVLFNPAPQSA